MWQGLRKLSIQTEKNINKKAMESLFTAFQPLLYQSLKITTLDMFFEVFDQDQDGVLNEDDQILIFSVTKERMVRLSKQVLEAQHYDAYSRFMAAIRDFEHKIVFYQNELRQALY